MKTIRIKQNLLRLLAGVLLAACPGWAWGETWDVARDWHGPRVFDSPWAYRTNTRVFPTYEAANRESVFAIYRGPEGQMLARNTGAVPAYLPFQDRRTELPADAGAVVCHPNWHTDVPTVIFRWTSPVDGRVNVAAAVKMLNAGGNQWRLEHNGEVLKEGRVCGTGQAGTATLNGLSVAKGDVLEVKITSAPHAANLCQVEFSLTRAE